jgi:hypothetical protein
MRTKSRAVGMTVITVTVTTLATGCHSGSTSAVGSPSSGQNANVPSSSGAAGAAGAAGGASPDHPRAAALASCRTGALRMSVDTSQADGATGSTYYPIEFVNTSASACALAGYPGVSFVTAAAGGGQQIGAAAERNPAFRAVTIRLAPGGYAHAWLQVAEAANYPEPMCRPATARALRVFPPDETRPGYVSQDFAACSIQSAQLLTVMPVRGGKGIQGSVP